MDRPGLRRCIRERQKGERDGALRSQDLQQEDTMTKGKLKGNKEVRKPRSEKPKGAGSAYKQGQGKGIPVSNPFAQKK